MDINTNVSQQKAAVLTPLKTSGVKLSVEKPVQREIDAAGNEELRSATVSMLGDTKAKDDKESGDLEQAVDTLNGYIQNVQRNLQFSIDKDSGTMVVKVIDANSEKVIRQMPTEETLRLARHLAEDKQEVTFNIFSSRA
jgi:flagellar protein FlaG